MSRCFPYPPPGFAGNAAASNDALILTIKLQRESDNVKSEKKKDRKREKKEKRREDKANGTLFGEKKVPATDEKPYQAAKFAKYSEDCNQIKQQEASCERMEKSSLTEEHGKPCCSSDSTENSGKRKRLSPPQAGNTTRTPGTVFRIVLNSRKKEDAPTTSSSNVTVSLPAGRVDTSSQKSVAAGIKSLPAGRVDTSSQKSVAAGIKSSAAILPTLPAKTNSTQQLITTSSSAEKLPCPVNVIDQGSTSKEEKKLPRPLRKYKALFENWVPPSMEVDAVDGEDDWLFASKRAACQPEKRIKCCAEEVPNYGKPALQPRARYLSDADIYALPFTVPF